MPSSRTRDDLLANPAESNAEINAVIDAPGFDKEIPTAPEPPDDLVRLPGGLVRGGAVVRTATVRELTGSDEEALSKALKSGTIVHFMDTLITRGTETIGAEQATREILKDLLLGDRDELALAIRRATYGDRMTIEGWTCPSCSAQSDIGFSLADDVERVTLANPAVETVFEVALRKGAKVKVRLPNGADQAALFEDINWSAAQRNTVLLSRCVTEYTDPAGNRFQVIAAPSIVLNLPIPDRQKIIEEISNRQPGPRYNEVKFTHDECQNQVVLALGVADLFRDLILFL